MADIEVIEKIDETIKVKIPKLYKVLLHNDDKTTFDFVIIVLTNIFHQTLEAAVEITKAIHVAGEGVAGGPYTHEVALEKINEVHLLARANGFPLTASIDEM
jgi:ATP-dependent Clp protease adaptor protein ClpS